MTASETKSDLWVMDCLQVLDWICTMLQLFFLNIYIFILFKSEICAYSFIHQWDTYMFAVLAAKRYVMLSIWFCDVRMPIQTFWWPEFPLLQVEGFLPYCILCMQLPLKTYLSPISIQQCARESRHSLSTLAQIQKWEPITASEEGGGQVHRVGLRSEHAWVPP